MSEYNSRAFPRAAGEFDGMMLRDWFAGQIAAALCSATDSAGLWQAPLDRTNANIVAERAYVVADALLAERERRQ